MLTLLRVVRSDSLLRRFEALPLPQSGIGYVGCFESRPITLTTRGQ
jgi:hypothetical protein